MANLGNLNNGITGDANKDFLQYKIQLERRLNFLLNNINVTNIIFGLSPSQLVSTSVDGNLSSADLVDFILGTTNQITVTDNLNGKVTLSLPQSIATTSTPTFAGLIGGTATNNMTIEADGTIKFNGTATYWRDIDFPIIIRTTGANIPTLTTLQGNITVPQWQVNDFNVCEGQELVHEWKEGSRVYWHVHMITNGLDTTDRFVKWEVEYCWVNGSDVLTANTTVSSEFTIPANTADKTMFIVPISDFVPTNAKIGGHIYARLKRIASTGTAPTNNPWCSMLQLHIECDTVGSRTMTAK